MNRRRFLQTASLAAASRLRLRAQVGGARAFEFGRHAFARPDFTGWTVCGWVDTRRTMPRKEFKLHSGFFAPDGAQHAPYVARLRELPAKLYSFAQP